jgi:hypothetical protein
MKWNREPTARLPFSNALGGAIHLRWMGAELVLQNLVDCLGLTVTHRHTSLCGAVYLNWDRLVRSIGVAERLGG